MGWIPAGLSYSKAGSCESDQREEVISATSVGLEGGCACCLLGTALKGQLAFV